MKTITAKVTKKAKQTARKAKINKISGIPIGAAQIPSRIYQIAFKFDRGAVALTEAESLLVE